MYRLNEFEAFDEVLEEVPIFSLLQSQPGKKLTANWPLLNFNNGVVFSHLTKHTKQIWL